MVARQKRAEEEQLAAMLQAGLRAEMKQDGLGVDGGQGGLGAEGEEGGPLLSLLQTHSDWLHPALDCIFINPGERDLSQDLSGV